MARETRKVMPLKVREGEPREQEVAPPELKEPGEVQRSPLDLLDKHERLLTPEPLRKQLKEIFGDKLGEAVGKEIEELFQKDNVNGISLPEFSRENYSRWRELLFSGKIPIKTETQHRMQKRGFHGIGAQEPRKLNGIYDPLAGENGEIAVSKGLLQEGREKELAETVKEELVHSMHAGINTTFKSLLDDLRKDQSLAESDRVITAEKEKTIAALFMRQNPLTEAFKSYVLDKNWRVDWEKELDSKDEEDRAQFFSNSTNIGRAYLTAMQDKYGKDLAHTALFAVFGEARSPEGSDAGPQNWAQAALDAASGTHVGGIMEGLNGLTNGKYAEDLRKVAIPAPEKLNQSLMAAFEVFKTPSPDVNVGVSGEAWCTYESSDPEKNRKPKSGSGMGTFMNWCMRYWLGPGLSEQERTLAAVNWMEMNQSNDMVQTVMDLEYRKYYRDYIGKNLKGLIDPSKIEPEVRKVVANNVFRSIVRMFGFKDIPYEGQTESGKRDAEGESDAKGHDNTEGHVMINLCQKHMLLETIYKQEGVKHLSPLKKKIWGIFTKNMKANYGDLFDESSMEKDYSMRDTGITLFTYLYTDALGKFRQADNSTKQHWSTLVGSMPKSVYHYNNHQFWMNENITKEEAELMANMWSAYKGYLTFQSKPGKDMSSPHQLYFMNGFLDFAKGKLLDQSMAQAPNMRDIAENRGAYGENVDFVWNWWNDKNKQVTLAGNHGGFLDSVMVYLAKSKLKNPYDSSSDMGDKECAHLYEASTGFQVKEPGKGGLRDHVYWGFEHGANLQERYTHGRYLNEQIKEDGQKVDEGAHVRDVLVEDGRIKAYVCRLKGKEGWYRLNHLEVDEMTGEIKRYRGPDHLPGESVEKLSDAQAAGVVENALFDKHKGKAIRKQPDKKTDPKQQTWTRELMTCSEDKVVECASRKADERFGWDPVDSDFGLRWNSLEHRQWVKDGFFMFNAHLAREKFEGKTMIDVRAQDDTYIQASQRQTPTRLENEWCRLLCRDFAVEHGIVAEEIEESGLKKPTTMRDTLARTEAILGSRWSGHFSGLGERFIGLSGLNDIQASRRQIYMHLAVKAVKMGVFYDPDVTIKDLAKTYGEKEVQKIATMNNSEFRDSVRGNLDKLNAGVNRFRDFRGEAVKIAHYFYNHPEELSELTFNIEGRNWRERALMQSAGDKEGDEMVELDRQLPARIKEGLQDASGIGSFNREALVLFLHVVDNGMHEAFQDHSIGDSDAIMSKIVRLVNKRPPSDNMPTIAADTVPENTWRMHIKRALQARPQSNKGDFLVGETQPGPEDDVISMGPEMGAGAIPDNLRTEEGYRLLRVMIRYFENAPTPKGEGYEGSLYQTQLLLEQCANRDLNPMMSQQELAEKTSHAQSTNNAREKEDVGIISSYQKHREAMVRELRRMMFPCEGVEEEQLKNKFGKSVLLMRSLGYTYLDEHKERLKAARAEGRDDLVEKHYRASAEKVYAYLQGAYGYWTEIERSVRLAADFGTRTPSITRGEARPLTTESLEQVRMVVENSPVSRLTVFRGENSQFPYNNPGGVPLGEVQVSRNSLTRSENDVDAGQEVRDAFSEKKIGLGQQARIRKINERVWMVSDGMKEHRIVDEHGKLMLYSGNTTMIPGIAVAARRHMNREALSMQMQDPTTRLFMHRYSQLMEENQGRLDEVEREYMAGNIDKSERTRRQRQLIDGNKPLFDDSSERVVGRNQVYDEALKEFADLVAERNLTPQEYQAARQHLSTWYDSYSDAKILQNSRAMTPAIRKYQDAYEEAKQLKTIGKNREDPEGVLHVLGRRLQVLAVNAEGWALMDTQELYRAHADELDSRSNAIKENKQLKRGETKGHLKQLSKESSLAQKKADQLTRLARRRFLAANRFSVGLDNDGGLAYGREGDQSEKQWMEKFEALYRTIFEDRGEAGKPLVRGESLESIAGMLSSHALLKRKHSANWWKERAEKLSLESVTPDDSLDWTNGMENGQSLEMIIGRRARSEGATRYATAEDRLDGDYFMGQSLRTYEYRTAQMLVKSGMNLLYLHYPSIIHQLATKEVRNRQEMRQSTAYLNSLCSRHWVMRNVYASREALTREQLELGKDFYVQPPQSHRQKPGMVHPVEVFKMDENTVRGRGAKNMALRGLKRYVEAAEPNLQQLSSHVAAQPGVGQVDRAMWLDDLAPRLGFLSREFIEPRAEMHEPTQAGIQLTLANAYLGHAVNEGQLGGARRNYRAVARTLARKLPDFEAGLESPIGYYTNLRAFLMAEQASLAVDNLMERFGERRVTPDVDDGGPIATKVGEKAITADPMAVLDDPLMEDLEKRFGDKVI